VELVGGLGAGLDRRAAGHAQRPDHLDLAVTGLGHARGGACEHGPGGGLGVDRVGLAAASAGRPVGAVDLEHDLAVGMQEAQQPRGVGAGAFDAEALDLAQPACPGEQLPVAAGGGGHRGGGEQAAELVDRGGDVQLAVAVDPDRDQAVWRWHAA
jgi:hypothetical protein